MEALTEAFGAIGVLHNHAGVLPLQDPSILELDEATIDEALSINVKGMMLVAKHVARRMVQAGAARKGVVVNTASDLSMIALPGISGYVTSKSAIPGLTRSMAVDLAPHGIRVNAVCPGFTYTAMVTGLMADRGGAGGDPADVPDPAPGAAGGRGAGGAVPGLGGAPPT